MSELSPEATAPKRAWLSDLWRIGVIIILTVSTRVWVLRHTEVLSRDSVGFIRFALQLEDPALDASHPGERLSRFELLRHHEHPPGYSAALMVVSWPVRAVMGGTNCDSMVVSAQLTSILSAMLLVLPMFYLGKLLFDRQTAFVGTMLFQTLPVFTAISSDGLSDSFFLLVSVTGLLFAAMAFRRQSTPWFVAAGLMSGAAYLVRPEGLMLVFASGIVLLGCKWRGSVAWRPTLIRGTAMVAATALVGGPYVAIIGGLTNKPTGARILRNEEQHPGWIVSQTEDVHGSSILIAEWYHGTSLKMTLWAFKALGLELLKSSFYVIPFLALFGLWLSRRRLGSDAALFLLLLVAMIQIALLIVVGQGAGYVAGRHTLVIVLSCCFFAAAALPALGALIARIPATRFASEHAWAAIIAVALIGVTAPSSLKKMHANRQGHHAAGLWLAHEMGKDDMLIDPFCWAEYYAGFYRDEAADPKSPKRVFAVVEDPDRSPHPRLHRMRAAFDIANRPDVELVYHWPVDKPTKEAKVYIFCWRPM